MPCLHTERQAGELAGPKTSGDPAAETTRRSREKKEERHRGRVLSPLRNLRTKAEKWGFRKGLDDGERESNENSESTTNRRIRKNSCFVKMSTVLVQMQPELNVLLPRRRRESHPPCGSSWRLAPSAAQDRPWLCFSLNHSEDLAKLLLFPESSSIHQYPFPRTARSPRSAGPCGLGKGCDWIIGLLGDRASYMGLQEICEKVLVHICDVLAAERCSLAMITTDETGKQVLGPFFHSTKSAHSQTRQDWDKCLMGHVASTGWPLNISDTNEDPRCSKGVHKPVDCRPKSALSVPILNQQAEVIGVVMAVNKKGKVCFFSKNDEKVLSSHMALLGVIVDNKQLTEKTDQQCQHSQVVLELVQLMAEQHQCVETLLTKMATVILQACKANLCNVFISDPESKEPFSWMVCVENSEQSQSTLSSRRDVDQQDVFYAYALQVWNSMEMLNVAMERRLTQPVAAGVHLHSLICAPIRNRQKKGVLGVCQLLNTASADPGEGSSFSTAEERLLQIFVEYCSLAFHTVSVQKTAERSLNKLTVTEEVLSYHLCSCAVEAEAEDFQECMVPSALSLGLMDFSFSDADLPAAASTQAAVRMFLDLNLLQNFSMDYKILCQWVLSVRRGYRCNIAYHNWSHALSTAHCMFAILRRTEQLQRNLSSLEILALMISALSHDLDHRGVNNSYIERAQQPIAQLYTHSALEHHHLNICLLILNTPETGILDGLSAEDYKACIGMIEKNILATDLNVHLQKRAELFEVAENHRLQWKNEDHRDLLRSALMTACDVCSITKPWPVQKRVAQLVAEEFFAQGDREIHEFNIQPIAVMDRVNSTRLPELQIQYIDSICTPLYQALSTLFEPCAPLLDGCMKNRDKWESLVQGKEENKDVVKG
ncbi:cGMP-specific 3',5'-cyclic phosphodiesterase isoform X1 [Astyanax mexicanus]|uniref:cGMP-specific 3',5'-cyclic phosphodiesterase isoform X1 n=1 Tax=Astyanax mexicanus TaxID=7994 RepID=UPI0020CAD0DF|nr:cGMP-specific 3',5'-cyclic phosphodiesterase isoform X1 [Astyanax mexicanus]